MVGRAVTACLQCRQGKMPWLSKYGTEYSVRDTVGVKMGEREMEKNRQCDQSRKRVHQNYKASI